MSTYVHICNIAAGKYACALSSGNAKSGSLDPILMPPCTNSPEYQDTLDTLDMVDGCDSCRVAKATVSTALFKQRPEGKMSTHLYQLVHTDIWGSPHKTMAVLSGAQY